MKELLNVPYSQYYSDKRRLDIFLPKKNARGICIFFIHGGGWNGGNRTKWHSVARYFCEQGYTCASVGYRLAPENTYPEQIIDVRLAMSYIRENAPRFMFTSHNVVAVGSSAGAHLVLMLSTIDPEDILGYSEEIKVPDTRPSIAICYCPVTTVHLTSELWKGRPELPEFVPQFMGTTEDENPEIFIQASPLDRITGKEPPTLFIHGKTDTIVPIQQSTLAYQKMKRLGVYTELVVLPNAVHGFGYGTETPEQKESIKRIKAFLDTTKNSVQNS